MERLLRYCARPAFALERLREIDAGHLVYESVKPGPGGSVSLMLTPLELIERLAALIPPPRRHRHRYYDQQKSLWDEVLPLACPRCGGEMRIIAFITEAVAVRDILAHLGEATSPPRMARPVAHPCGRRRCRAGRVRPTGPTGAELRIRSAHCL
jgi:hypothetical protein